MKTDQDVRSLSFLAMKAMILESLGEVKPPHAPLRLVQHPEPTLAPGEVLLRVTRCGVCHTELDEIEGRTPPPRLPVILGHQVVGIVEDSRSDSGRSETTEVGTTGRSTCRCGMDRVRVRALSVLLIGSGKSLSRLQGDRARHQRRLCRIHESPRGLCPSHP